MSNEKRNLMRRRNRLLEKLHSIGPIIEGSMVTTQTKCGKSNCKCAKGPGHKVTLFTWKKEGKTQTLFVSKNIFDEVQDAWDSYLRLKKVIKDLSTIQIALLRLEAKRDEGRKKQQS